MAKTTPATKIPAECKPLPKAPPSEKPAKVTKKVYKFPKLMGACADLLYALKTKRLFESKAVKEIQAEETALKLYIIDTLPRSETTGVAGKAARVTIVLKHRPEITNWEEFIVWCVKTKNTDMLSRTLNAEAVQTFWDTTKKQIPGVGSVQYKSISLNKI